MMILPAHNRRHRAAAGMQKRGEKTTSPRPPASAKPGVAKPSADEPTDLKPVALGRSSDEDLMRRTQQGDRQAFSLLYERYSASVLSYLYRMMRNLEDEESNAQELFPPSFRLAPLYRHPQ